jgi:UDP-GlcNAc:undecaprenyl-phosphate GlcNAc-1-phosphate transferase
VVIDRDGQLMTTESVIVTVAALVTTAVLTPLCIVTAHRYRILDRAGPLKPQATPVPYLGGVAVFFGVAIGASVDRPLVLIPLGLALVVGVLDDRFEVAPGLRLVAQLAIGIAIVATQPVHPTGGVAVAAIVAIAVLLINGFNLLDGLDMLAGGVGLASAVGFALLDHEGRGLLALALAGALAAFLAYNRFPARIYLGDGGSYLLGATVTVLLCRAWGAGIPTPVGVLALALVAIPVTEVACALVRRTRSKLSLLTGDRGHPYDRLVQRGWPRPAASAVYIGAEVIVVLVVGVLRPSPSMAVAVAVDVGVGIVLLACAALAGGLDQGN